jgi:hypothetical protein
MINRRREAMYAWIIAITLLSVSKVEISVGPNPTTPLISHTSISMDRNLKFEIVYNHTELTVAVSMRSLYLRPPGVTIMIYAVNH